MLLPPTSASITPLQRSAALDRQNANRLTPSHHRPGPRLHRSSTQPLKSPATVAPPAQIRLQRLLVADEADSLADHLGNLIGLPAILIKTDPASVPAYVAAQSPPHSR